jgi:hypothetical protein
MNTIDDQQVIRDAMRILGKRTSARKKKTSAQNAEKARAKRVHLQSLTNKMQNSENKA